MLLAYFPHIICQLATTAAKSPTQQHTITPPLSSSTRCRTPNEMPVQALTAALNAPTIQQTLQDSKHWSMLYRPRSSSLRPERGSKSIGCATTCKLSRLIFFGAGEGLTAPASAFAAGLGTGLASRSLLLGSTLMLSMTEPGWGLLPGAAGSTGLGRGSGLAPGST
jgi:hypothetical protein